MSETSRRIITIHNKLRLVTNGLIYIFYFKAVFEFFSEFCLGSKIEKSAEEKVRAFTIFFKFILFATRFLFLLDA